MDEIRGLNRQVARRGGMVNQPAPEILRKRERVPRGKTEKSFLAV
jgi:hypothetical protein